MATIGKNIKGKAEDWKLQSKSRNLKHIDRYQCKLSERNNMFSSIGEKCSNLLGSSQ